MPSLGSREEFLAVRAEWRATERALRFWERVDFGGPDECWPWIGNFTSQKYGIFNWQGKTKAHREAVVQSGRSIPPGAVVLHLCDNPPCVNPRHLRVGTPEENSLDAARKGRMNFRPHKLTECSVREIRRWHAAGWTYREIAERFGVSPSMVASVVKRKTWRWVA